MRGRKRTKYTITIEQMNAYRQLSERLQLDKIINGTTIFKEHINHEPLHQPSVDQIKDTFTLWFNSWIKPHLDKM